MIIPPDVATGATLPGAGRSSTSTAGATWSGVWPVRRPSAEPILGDLLGLNSLADLDPAGGPDVVAEAATGLLRLPVRWGSRSRRPIGLLPTRRAWQTQFLLPDSR